MKSFLKTLLLVIAVPLFWNSSHAQTTVCSGDSVVLVLTTRTSGTTVWEQSPDDTTWSAASGNSYNDSLVVTATATNYYRAIVTDGTCNPYYSDTVLVTVTTPTPPVAKPASGVTLYSFQANWTAVADAKAYYIDVATDSGFTAYVFGYQNKKVDNVTKYVVPAQCNTTYYYRVRDSSSICRKLSGNSNTMSVSIGACPVECTYKSTCNGNITDARDGKIYKTIQIGSQCWMAENLNYGTRIDGVKLQTQADTITGRTKYCYGDGENNCKYYGALYLWDAMMDYHPSVTTAPGPKGICPTGWHLPVDSEYTCLENTLGGAIVAGNKLKDSTTWKPYTGIINTNSSGFTALAAGLHGLGLFGGQGSYTYFWTATEDDATFAWDRNLSSYEAQSGRDTYLKAPYGLSVRCVKD